jgi:hypothetical protein
MTISPTSRLPLALLAWGAIAAVAGLASFAVPPYVLPDHLQNPVYGAPLIGWFALAYANFAFKITFFAQAFLGLILGLAQPRFWLLLACLTASLPMLLNALNVVHDCLRDPTSHNLWPFEFVILLIMASPVLPGAFIGSKLRRFKLAQSR